MSLLLFISIRDIFLVILGSTNLSMATISDNMSWVLSLNSYGGFKFPQLLSKTQMVRKIMCCFLEKKLFLKERTSCMHFKYLKHNGLILIKIMAVGKSVSLAPKPRNDALFSLA